jgi:hypothetical protein
MNDKNHEHSLYLLINGRERVFDLEIQPEEIELQIAHHVYEQVGDLLEQVLSGKDVVISAVVELRCTVCGELHKYQPDNASLNTILEYFIQQNTGNNYYVVSQVANPLIKICMVMIMSLLMQQHIAISGEDMQRITNEKQGIPPKRKPDSYLH